jgi:tetratricopeptide (TPR) repeat protein
MTGRIEKTVFISYRRTNFWTALAVFQHLHSNGYDVFFDYKSIPSGDFEQVITENVKFRAHFLVILSPSALERCNEPGDWLRHEIELAIDNKRNVIPLMMEGFDFGSPATAKALTGKLSELKKYNGLGIPAEYFEEAMMKLRSERFLNRPLDVVSHPVSDITTQITDEQKSAAVEAPLVDEEQLSAQEWFEQGKKNYYIRNFSEAIRCYTEAIRLIPNFPDAYYNHAIAREDEGDLDGAIQDYEQIDRMMTDNIKDNHHVSNMREIQKLLDHSMEDYYEDDLFKDESARLNWIRGTTLFEKGDFDGAITDYSEVIHLRPDFPGIYRLRGNAYRHKGDLDGAIADYGKAIDIEPDDAIAYYERGITQQFKGEINNALEDLTKTLFIKPDHAMAMVSLFGLLRKLGRKAEAREYEQILRVLIIKEDEYNRGCFEAIRGNTDKALELLKVGLKKGQLSKEWARQDPGFENLRDDPRFKELVGE